MFGVDDAIRAVAVRQEALSTHTIGPENDVSIQVRAGQLTDRDISREVIAALEGNSLVPEGRVWVGVSNGWVTLKGQVDRNYQRAIAARTVGDLPSVRGVTVGLTLRLRTGVRFNGES